MKIVGVIPARYNSSRLPGKPLIHILGKPLVIRVAKVVSDSLGKENTYIATDDERIKKVAKEHGYKSVMTSSSCLTGTDRVAEFAKKIHADIYINIQGDEPLIDKLSIKRVIDEKINSPSCVINCMTKIFDIEQIKNINTPKVVFNKNNELIYISRAPVPAPKSINDFQKIDYYKQVCIYAFNKKELNLFSKNGFKSKIEAIEDIEILRFFDLGIKIKMLKVDNGSLAVDTFEDIDKVERALLNKEIN